MKPVLELLIFTAIAIVGGVLIFLLIQLNYEPTYDVIINPIANNTYDEIPTQEMRPVFSNERCNSNSIQYNNSTGSWECGQDNKDLMDSGVWVESNHEVIDQKLDKIIELLEKKK